MDDTESFAGGRGDQYGTRQANYDPTVADDMYPPPTRDYPPQPPYGPPTAPAAPVRPNPLFPVDDPPTIHIPTRMPTSRRLVVAPPVIVRGNGESAARTSLMLGIISFLISWIPVCGIVALLPAALGIFFGWRGRNSRQRNIAILGMLLSTLAIALALAVIA